MSSHSTNKHHVLTGLEVFLTGQSEQLTGKRVGLLTNTTGIDHHLHYTVDLLRADSRVRLEALFGPEHGILGDAQDGVPVANSVDRRTGLPIYSLFGLEKSPPQEILAKLDALIFDIQDVGARYYTYPATMLLALDAVHKAGIEFVVFDRPNPITGSSVEGNILDPAYISLVGAYTLPTRHGLTMGELVRLYAVERGYTPPTVFPVQGWQRAFWFDETDFPWVLPSPNMPTFDTAVLYPGMCLLEGTNVSEGRGTTRPFEIFGAPWLDPFHIVEALERLSLPGVAFRVVYFTPTTSKYAGELCGGVQVHITERAALEAVRLGVCVLHTIHALYPEHFAWRRRPDGSSYSIDLLYGSNALRDAIDHDMSIDHITRDWGEGVASFIARSKPHWLYE